MTTNGIHGHSARPAPAPVRQKCTTHAHPPKSAQQRATTTTKPYSFKTVPCLRPLRTCLLPSEEEAPLRARFLSGEHRPENCAGNEHQHGKGGHEWTGSSTVNQARARSIEERSRSEHRAHVDKNTTARCQLFVGEAGLSTTPSGGSLPGKGHFTREDGVSTAITLYAAQKRKQNTDIPIIPIIPIQTSKHPTQRPKPNITQPYAHPGNPTTQKKTQDFFLAYPHAPRPRTHLRTGPGARP